MSGGHDPRAADAPHLDEYDVEALLSGIRGDAPRALVDLVDAMRSPTSVPGPNAELQALFLARPEGASDEAGATEPALPVAQGAPTRAGMSRTPTTQGRRRAASRPLATRLAFGAAVVLSLTTGAGALGALPGSVQHGFSRIAPFGDDDMAAPGPSTPVMAARQSAPTPETTAAPAPAAPGPAAGARPAAAPAAGQGTEPDAAPGPTTPTAAAGPDGAAVRASGSTPGPTTAPAPAAGAGTPPVSSPPTTAGAPAPTVPPTTAPPPTVPPTTKPATVPVSLALQCRVNRAVTTITCSWSVTAPTPTASYDLVRTGPDGTTTVLAGADPSVRSFADDAFERGATYTYVVYAHDASGTRVGRSASVKLTAAR